MFDPQKQTLLRQLKGHQRPVHTTRFAPDKMHVLSGSDDATVSVSSPIHNTFQALQCSAYMSLQPPDHVIFQKQPLSRASGHVC